MRFIRAFLPAVVLVGLCSCSASVHTQTMDHPPDTHPKLQAILKYISSSWNVLTRSTMTCEAVADPKLTETVELYAPADFAIPPALQKLPLECKVRVEHLPFPIRGPGQVTGNGIHPPGLLFLPNLYVVPGGRFNEMYGWDSYFIIRGLLREGKIDLARGMVENFFFEIEHYGGVLNANRTYYLTRSQPPFLSSMIIAVYEAEKACGHADFPWLARAYRYANQDYESWVRDPHLAGSTGLSRYWDFGEGPVPEGLHDESDYYHDVLAFFLKQKQPSPYLVVADSAASLQHPEYSLGLCEDGTVATPGSKCKVVKRVALSPDYYKGDRSMRESGFDISFRFEPFGAEAHHYAPVCLNSLLYKTETDLAKMATWLGDKPAATQWRERAKKRQQIIQTLLWNERAGMFFDYNFQTRTQSSYEYATTFYPLWAGLATPAQARSVAKNLHLFEQEGGLAMSTKDTGVQWDYPFGWAPIQLLAVEGLRRYRYNADADRISVKFLSMVLANFARDGNIREKYDVVADSSNVKLSDGYRDNIIGFGWTNGVFLELLHQLRPDSLARWHEPAH